MGNGTEDLLYLVDGGRAGEQSLPQEHLPQDTAYAPHVDPFGIPRTGAQQLTHSGFDPQCSVYL